MAVPENFSAQFVPVLIGSTRQSGRLARRLFWRYGVTSHLFDTALRPGHRLTPWLVCHKLTGALPSEVALLALTDLAHELEAADRTPILYLGSMRSELSKANIAALEACFILRDEADGPIDFKGGSTP